MKNRGRGLALLTGSGLFFVAVLIAAMSFWAFSQTEEASLNREQTTTVINSASELLSEIKDAETAMRGYALTGDATFLLPYNRVKDTIGAHVEVLLKYKVIPGAKKHLESLAPLVAEKMEETARIVSLKQNNQSAEASSAIAAGKGRRLMDSIRYEINSFIGTEKGFLESFESEFRTNMRRLFAVSAAASAFMLFFALSFAYMVYKESRNQLDILIQAETQRLLSEQEVLNTKLQQVNSILQVSEEKFAVTLNSIGDAVLATDDAGCVTLLNPHAEKLTGWKHAEAFGRPVEQVFIIINQETRLPSVIPVKQTLEHGTVHGLANHTILISKDGSEYVIADSCAPIRNRDGKVVGAVLVFRDVTERSVIEMGIEKTRIQLDIIKKSEDEAREYSESIINTIREPLIALDQDLRVVSVSRSFYEVFKVKAEETVGQLIYDLGNKQWNIPKLRELLENILPQKATFDNYEVEHDFATIGRRIMLLNARQIKRVLGKERVILLAIEDITERREIENGLEKARKELEATKISEDAAREYSESIINTIREPLIALDQDLRVVSASRAFYEVFKVKPAQTLGQLIYDLGNKQWDIPKLRELLENILPQKATFDNYEVEHDFTTIGRRIMLLNARQIERLMGKERIILLSIEDITIRREFENGLEKARKELEATKISEDAAREYSESIINTIREPLIALDQDLRVVSASRAFYEVFKVKPAQTLGQLIYDLGNKQWDIPKLRELLENILPQKATFDNYEVEHDFADIGRRIMLLNARQIQRVLGKERIILLSIEDITVRREIENGLEKARKELASTKISEDEAREYAESMINTVREPLIVLDQDLRVVSVSRSFYEVFKVKVADTVGQLIYDLGNKQWNIPKLRELLETILPQKATFDNYEVEHDFATIGRRIMLLNARQIQRVLGKERIILLAIEDITERREIENGLEKARKELKTLATELERTAKVKSEFLANMSHELRTPLNSINGFSEVLYDETFGQLNEKQKKYVNNVLTSGKHLLLLINQILDMAKVEAGKMKAELITLPMKNLLNEISLLVADLAGKKKIQIQLDIAEDLPDIEADELKVKEIIYNLLSNAVKFTPEGGNIGMRAKKKGKNIEVTVWDTGVGIAPENMEKIFEGFFRVDTPFSRVTEGTGLGLPLSKKMVELHGGTLSVESKGLGRGTSVIFTLPISPEGKA